MFSKLKSSTVQLLGPLGAYNLARTLTRNSPRIIMYHRFSQEAAEGKLSAQIFERQLAYLKRNFTILPLPDVVAALTSEEPLPKNTLVITVDDGYLDFYTVCFPILKKYKTTATLYATTDFIDGIAWLWPDKLEYILTQLGDRSFSIKLDDREMKVKANTKQERRRTWTALVEYCISVSNTERLHFISSFVDASGLTVPDSPGAGYEAMNWNQLKELADSGISIGAHTKSHPILSKLESGQHLDEILGCKQVIEDHINRPVTCFCYPNGQPSDFTDAVKNQVISAGFNNATVAFYDSRGWQDMFEIRRHGVDADMFQFYKAVNGVETLSHSLGM